MEDILNSTSNDKIIPDMQNIPDLENYPEPNQQNDSLTVNNNVNNTNVENDILTKDQSLKSATLDSHYDTFKEKIFTEITSLICDYTNERFKALMLEHGRRDDKSNEIKRLYDEVDFLRKEITNKNNIIEILMSKERKTIESNDIPKIINTTTIKEHSYKKDLHRYDYESNDNDSSNSISSFESNTSISSGDETSDSSETNSRSYKTNANQQWITDRKHLRKKHIKKINKSHHVSRTKNSHQWPPNTTLIAGDSMLSGIVEKKLTGKKKSPVKVRVFPGASIEDMYDFMKPLMRKSPSNIILHVGANNCADDSSREILDKLLSLKYEIEKQLPKCNVYISKLIDRYDDAIARCKVKHVNNHINSLKLKVVDNDNITTKHLDNNGLHMLDIGTGKLAVNFIKTIKKFKSRNHSGREEN